MKSAAQTLSEKIGAPKVVSSGPEYERARKTWNPLVDMHPELIVLCESTEDVSTSVSFAVSNGISLSVRGGGASGSGRPIQGQMVLDLTRMNDVVIEGQSAAIGGGTLTMRLAEAAGVHGLTPITGIVGSVGVAGLTLGGGYGHFTAKYGLALDNMLGADVVLADGSVVQTDEAHEPDLFWALRGGCGNFGVVTKLRIRLQPIADCYDGVVLFPWEQAIDVFNAYDSFIAIAPDELTLKPFFFTTPEGQPHIMLQHTWCGARYEDERVLDQVKAFGKPSKVDVSRRTFVDSLRRAESRAMTGMYRATRTVTLPKLSTEVVEIIIDAMNHRSSSQSWMAAHPFYGFGERVPLESTAFGIRQRHQMLGIFGVFKPGDDRVHRAWTDRVEVALKPFALPSAYPNYFETDRPEQQDVAFGVNSERILRLKRKYDPNDVFDYRQLPRHTYVGSYVSR